MIGMFSHKENENSYDILGKRYPGWTTHQCASIANTYRRDIFMRVQAAIIGSVENIFVSSETSIDLFT
jgi:hypothetical protein